MRRLLLCTLAVFMVVGLFQVTLAGAEEAAPAPAAEAPAPKMANEVGAQVPPWTATLVEGGTVKSDDYKGKTYAVIFVNSSCSACRAELTEVQKLRLEDKNVLIASLDFNPQRTLKTYREQMKLSFPVIDDSGQGLSGVFDFAFTPATVVVKDGKVAFRFGGYSAKHKDKLLKGLKNNL